MLIAVVTALATTAATSLLIAPRLEARNRRIQATYMAREQFSESVFAILGAVGRLIDIEVPEDIDEALREAFAGEQSRWRGQIDEATRHLVDHLQDFAFTYIGAMGFRDLVISYAANARMVWISQRAEQEKLRLLLDLTSPVQNIYFAARWRRRGLVKNIQVLRRTLADVQEGRR